MAQVFIAADAPSLSLSLSHTHTHTHTHTQMIMLCSNIFVILALEEDDMQLVVQAAIIFNDHIRKVLN